MSSLDGLRGIAVIAVLIYHADIGILPGGFLGVDIFFVLSGFLITSILLREIETTNTIDRTQFYLRRIRRLMPALFVMFIVLVVIVGFWIPDAAYPIRRDLPWALTWVLNWSYIFFDQSYFINISRPPMLGHLWSLAIEEQFYVIWPTFLFLLTKTKLSKNGIRKTTLVFSLLGATASSLWIAYLSNKNGYPVPNDPSRVYFGTDTHSMGLLLGCATAVVWPGHIHKHKLTADRKSAINLLGLLSFSAVIYFLFFISEYDSNLYFFGFALLSLLTAATVYAASFPSLLLARILSIKPLVWLGERSYGMYIWHWPIFVMFRPGIDFEWSESFNNIVRIAIVFIISELSYRYIEMPIRSGLIGSQLRIWRENGVPKPQYSQLIAVGAAFSIFISAGVGMYRAPVANANNIVGLGGITSIDQDPTYTPIDPQKEFPNSTFTFDPFNSVPTEPIPNINSLKVEPRSVVIFGDSVVLSALIPIQETFGDIAIDAEIGRQPAETADRIELRRTEDRLGTDVVIHMGTNGLITRNDLEPLLQSLSDRRRVVIVNVKVPRKWMDKSNEVIDELVPLFPNVRLADWATEAKGHRGYFGPDGVHLTKTGGKVFAALIKSALDAP